MTDIVDINEDLIRTYDPEVLDALLRDHTTQQNIFWATSDYEELGKGFEYHSPILPELITGEYIKVIRPRTLKARELQSARSREMAEVFTPSWICNAQNNLIDEAWFGRKDVFNTEHDDHTWTAAEGRIIFPEGKTWQDYVRDTRLEITCGEAPYLVSLYDTTTGTPIPLTQRVGLLDRKLRVVGENTDTTGEWLEWAQQAYMSLYGYEWQGDSLLLAREAMLYSFMDYYRHKFNAEPQKKSVKYIAYIVSWNLWQMDGLKFCPPGQEPCDGDLFTPTNLCLVKDWHTHNKDRQKVTFKSLTNTR